MLAARWAPIIECERLTKAQLPNYASPQSESMALVTHTVSVGGAWLFWNEQADALLEISLRLSMKASVISISNMGCCRLGVIMKYF